MYLVVPTHVSYLTYNTHSLFAQMFGNFLEPSPWQPIRITRRAYLPMYSVSAPQTTESEALGEAPWNLYVSTTQQAEPSLETTTLKPIHPDINLINGSSVGIWSITLH